MRGRFDQSVLGRSIFFIKKGWKDRGDEWLTQDGERWTYVGGVTGNPSRNESRKAHHRNWNPNGRNAEFLRDLALNKIKIFSLCLWNCLFVCPAVCPAVHLSSCLSLQLFVCLAVCPAVCPAVLLLSCLFYGCLSVQLFVCPAVCLSSCLSV